MPIIGDQIQARMNPITKLTIPIIKNHFNVGFVAISARNWYSLNILHPKYSTHLF